MFDFIAKDWSESKVLIEDPNGQIQWLTSDEVIERLNNVEREAKREERNAILIGVTVAILIAILLWVIAP